jgi:hypothetical protein
MTSVFVDGVWIDSSRNIWIHGHYIDESPRADQQYRAQITAAVLLANVDKIGTIIEVI